MKPKPTGWKWETVPPPDWKGEFIVKADNIFIVFVSIILIFLFSLMPIIISSCSKSDNIITLATTTSVYDSGVLDYIVPMFEKNTGYSVRVIAQGSGQALKTGEKGDADVLLVHSKQDEEIFMQQGYGEKRVEIMNNYFIIAGPENDPAGVKHAKNALDALNRIKMNKSMFVSRGDESGTHKKEIILWDMLKIEPFREKWHISAGKGMGDVLLMADEMNAYVLSDKATFLAMKNKLKLKILVYDNREYMKNPYSIITVSSKKHKNVNKTGADKFLEFMISEKVKKLINDFGKEKYGESLFVCE